ncbi:MAG: Clp protease ClpP [Alistipes sp.]|nr:Clp protease ClpP [Alistipes sp.]
MQKFWNWIHDDSGGRVLRLEGPIDSESFWGNEITPQDFRDELYAEEGDVTIWLTSPGGNVFAAADIYAMIRDYPHKVTVKIASIAASAASVIAMAGDTVQMSPVALLMVHDPSTIAMGNAKDMEKAISTLNEVKESIINAYAAKTGLSRSKISKLMSDETWINARKAVELGFADEILFGEKPKPEPDEENEPDDPEEPDKEGGDDEGDEEKKEPDKEKKPFKLDSGNALWQYSTRIMGQTILGKIGASCKNSCENDSADHAQKSAEKGLTPVIGMDGKTKDGAMPYEILKAQLSLLK